MVDKQYVTAQQLLEDSFKLGIEIYKSGFRPDYIVAVWRGGTPVGIAVQEILDYLGVETDHISIRTSAYEGIGKQRKEIRVHAVDYLISNINAEDSLLIVDDVYDTGLSVQAVIETLKERARKNIPHDIRIATVYYKPENNKTDHTPEYFVHETDKWLVFPHELNGLEREEIFANKPVVRGLLKELEENV